MGLTRLEEFAKEAMHGIIREDYDDDPRTCDVIANLALRHAVALEAAIDAYNLKHRSVADHFGNSSDADPQAQGHDAP